LVSHSIDFKKKAEFLFSSLCLISAKHLDETEDSSTRVLCSMRWSLIPPYHKGSLAEFKLVLNNCRSETIDVKPSFKRPLKNGQRCVILAEGFFEWKKNVSKMPFFIYQSKPFLNEKDYPNIDVEKILPKIEINKPPLLAMADIVRYEALDYFSKDSFFYFQ
jgi:hypothetical protein